MPLYFYQEIVAAMEGGCNVIPVMDNFCWPPVEHLPEDMRAVCYFNGIRWVGVEGTQESEIGTILMVH